jgi:hypothetical protein
MKMDLYQTLTIVLDREDLEKANIPDQLSWPSHGVLVRPQDLTMTFQDRGGEWLLHRARAYSPRVKKDGTVGVSGPLLEHMQFSDELKDLCAGFLLLVREVARATNELPVLEMP